ncbi:Aste57867_7236 [Aphanomyces stellatus]|nr:hypothetical protein As57867_007211 [Aphanomyces stellatus]VFT84161.1 Aste57867_7236 [Aphanomyces stellatus]
MKLKPTSLLLASSTVVASHHAYSALSPSDQSVIAAQLAKWMTLYGPIARANGFLPPQTESLTADSHSDDELERFHATLVDVDDAQRLNPEAYFSPFNQFALLTLDEFKRMLEDSFAGQNTTEAAPLDATPDLASDVDWATSKCNPPMKNQGGCGSCWAFASVGTVEFAHCLATDELLDLSEQQLVSCEKKSYGCGGGYPRYAIDWMQNGVCTEADYPYTSGKSGNTGTCNSSCSKRQLSIGKTKQTSGESSLMTVLNTQPASVMVEAGNSVWRNYKSGLVTHCPGAQSDHVVIAVGYGSKNGDY